MENDALTKTSQPDYQHLLVAISNTYGSGQVKATH
jgi:hypothetical protein